MKYLIICQERSSINTTVYWKPNSCGYTTNIEEAGRYTYDEVHFICNQPFVDDYYCRDIDDEINIVDSCM